MQKNGRTQDSRTALYLLSVALLILVIVSLFTGAYDIHTQADGWQMFFITRLPRTLSLLLSGSALAMSGLVMQLLTQNRFTEPSTSGTVEWAGLGLTLVYILVPAPTLIQRMAGAISFSFIGTLIFFGIIQKIKLQSSLIVPVVGIMLGAVISSFSSFLGLTFSLSQSLEVWFTGSFAQVQKGRYEFLWLILLIAIAIFVYADRLMIAALGKDSATNLGANYQGIVLVGIAMISLAVGVVTAVIGQLPFLGLIVPNIVVMWRGDNLRANLPYVCLLGMMLLTASDILARWLIAPLEMPVSLILSLMGAGMFLILLKQSQGGAKHG